MEVYQIQRGKEALSLDGFAYCIDADQHLEPLFQYFEQQWLKNSSLNIWNMHGIHRRTNNDLEGKMKACGAMLTLLILASLFFVAVSALSPNVVIADVVCDNSYIDLVVTVGVVCWRFLREQKCAKSVNSRFNLNE
uniref:Transmembrane protein n=1 Tax=Romanomermis culicivorax TaxID=13658 RepID=A0A915HGM3_ROMCU